MPRLLLAFAGLHHNGHTLTDADLSEVAETGNAIGEAPLTVGHPRGSAPQYGTVSGFGTGPYTNPLNGQATTGLFADVEPAPALKDAVDGGFFRQRSVGLSRDPQGRLYPHHLAVLGATPPACKGMPALQFGDDEHVETFAVTDADPAASTRADFGDGGLVARLLENEVERLASTGEDGDRADVLAALATEADVDPVTVQHILDGDIQRPRDEWLRAFARALGLSEQTLVDAAGYWYADPAAAPAVPLSPLPAPTVPDLPKTPKPTDATPVAPAAQAAANFADDPTFVAMQSRIARSDARAKSQALASLRTAAVDALGAPAADRLVAFCDAAFDAGSEDLSFSDAGTDVTADPISALATILSSVASTPARGRLDEAVDFGDTVTDTAAEDAKVLKAASAT